MVHRFLRQTPFGFGRIVSDEALPAVDSAQKQVSVEDLFCRFERKKGLLQCCLQRFVVSVLGLANYALGYLPHIGVQNVIKPEFPIYVSDGAAGIGGDDLEGHKLVMRDSVRGQMAKITESESLVLG